MLLLAAAVLVGIDRYQTRQVEDQFQKFSENELASLHALVHRAMEKRFADKSDIAVKVFNRWFDSRNKRYPGKLWSVWSPGMVDYVAHDDPAKAPKKPQDAVDEEVLRTGRPVGRFVGDTYRYSVPIVLGVTEGTGERICLNCHVREMGEKEGEVISAYSSSLDTAADFARLHRLLWTMAGAALLSVLAMILCIKLVFTRVISRPLARMTGVMGHLAAGDAMVEIPDTERRDETGDMARAVQVFKTNLIRSRELEAEQRADFEARQRRSERVEALTSGFNRNASEIVGGLAEAALNLEKNARSMNSTADQTSEKAVSVASAAEEASVNVQAVASAAEQLSNSIGEIGRQVDHSSEIAALAVEEASRTETEVAELAASVARIGDIVTLINDIAGQTNLLALNATIEAARAGEAGKGFAVVANEVKHLANQTARATGDIGDQIAAVQGKTETVVVAIKGILKVITEVGEIAATIGGAMQQQNMATQEIARNVEQAAGGTAEVSGHVVSVQQAAQSTSRNAAELLAASQDLSQQAKSLRGIIDGFLQEVGRA